MGPHMMEVQTKKRSCQDHEAHQCKQKDAVYDDMLLVEKRINVLN